MPDLNTTERLTYSVAENRMLRDERIIRGLLSRWVSEIEPIIVRQCVGTEYIIIGLNPAGHDGLPPVLSVEGIGHDT